MYIQLDHLVAKEKKRQKEGIELIPSENYASYKVRSYLSSFFVNKYSEGYPYKRYYGGNEFVDKVELLAQEKAKKIFNVPFVNVQPYSGSPANLAVYLAVCKPGDVIMGQALTAGGHLTHGHKVSATGIFYKSIQYGVSVDMPDLFDYDEIKSLAIRYRPKLIWIGATAHPLVLNFKEFSSIADAAGAVLAADISHIAGLIVGGEHPSPVEFVDIVTTTTHKTLRGPRGAMIMVTKRGIEKYPDLPQNINKAVFPGLQGGPHNNQTAAIVAALEEADTREFKLYARQIIKNSRALANALIEEGFVLIGGRSENHLILIDLTKLMGIGAGIFAQKALEFVGITLNKNTIPNEPLSPFYPSGIRLGTPAITTRGMKEKEMKMIGRWIGNVIHIIQHERLPVQKDKKQETLSKFDSFLRKNKELKKIHKEIKTLAKGFPLP